eukprot:gene46374-62021_t
MATIRTDRYKYVHFGGLPPLLFDLVEDPSETVDRSGDPALSAVRLELAERMLEWRARHLDRRLTGMEITAQGLVEPGEMASGGEKVMAALAAVGQAGDLESDWSPRRSGEGDRATRYLAVEHYKPWNWAIVAEAPLTEMMGEARNVLTWLWLGVVVALALLTVVLVMATRRLVGAPVQQLSTALAYLAQGDLTHAVSVRSRDEIGTLAQAMEGFRARL